MISENPAKSAIIFSLIAFVAISLFGLGHTAGMTVNELGDMAGCLFTGKTMLCSMDITEHIALWQATFTAIPQNISTFLVLVILLIAAIGILANHAPYLAATKQTTIRRLYFLLHPDITLFDPLKQAFFQGIIHPQIYKPVLVTN